MHLHLDTPGDTVWAVVIGAVLATVGGFVATQLEGIVRRRERQRNAAVMFGEILSALDTITTIAKHASARGDPYGSVTLRLMRAAQRETENYDRNRLSLYDLRDAEVRIRIHVMMVQLTMAFDGVSETSSRIEAADAELDTGDLPEARAAVTRERRQRWAEEREVAFGYTLQIAGEIAPLIAFLQPLAKVDFSELKAFSGNPFAEDENNAGSLTGRSPAAQVRRSLGPP